MKIRIKNLDPHVKFLISRIEGCADLFFDNPASPQNADDRSITWIKKNKDINDKVRSTKSSFIVINDNSSLHMDDHSSKAVIFSKNPKLTFARICKNFFTDETKPQIHDSTVISKNASIGEGSSIGPNCIIGNSTIGLNCRIMGNVTISDNVTLGDNVTVDFGAVLGSQGYGFFRNENNEIEGFPQLGGITIGNDVYIGANSTIDRGSLDDTIIGNGSKIDNLVHMAHNAVIGNNVTIIANAMIAGSAQIKDDSWIAPSVSILNQISVGERTKIGIGSVVLKNVPNDHNLMGNPALPLKEFLKSQKLRSSKDV